MQETAHFESKRLAITAADFVKKQLAIMIPVSQAVILGTGWGDCLRGENERSMPFKEIPGFENLGELEGHARQICYFELNGKPVIALRGRVHLNEAPADPLVHQMVRLQVEMLFYLGVKNLILTCAAGALPFVTGVNRSIGIGDILVIDGFLSLFAPDLPGFAAEFGSYEDTLDENLQQIAMHSADEIDLIGHRGGYAMVRGPFFEGRRYDKLTLAMNGASAVGMSILPEAAIASLYPGTKVLGLAFITNGFAEEHSHAANLQKAKESSEKLGQFLVKIIGKI